MSIWNYACAADLSGIYPRLYAVRGCVYCAVTLHTGTRSDVASGRRWGSEIDYCQECGWWRLKTSFLEEDAAGVPCVVNTKCAAGILKSLDVAALETPIAEIKQYLMTKESQIGQVAPQAVEKLVADVFRGLGYDCELTGRSKDGGIDLYYTRRGDHSVGAVQVKRRKNKTDVSQVRSFMGAMAPLKISEGVFVSTCGFTRDAVQYARSLEDAHVARIILHDAEWLLSLLRITKRDEYDGVFDPSAPYSALLDAPERIAWGFTGTF